MKVIILLAVLCSALAADPPHQHDPCLQACREATRTKLGADPLLAAFKPEEAGSTQGRGRIRTFIKNYLTGTGTIPAAVGNPETWTKLCTIATESDACVTACPDSPHKEGHKKFLSLFKLGCDADFKSSIGCLVEVCKEQSEPCNTKCRPKAAKVTEFIAQREANPTEVVHAPKDVLESGCTYVNCRLNCRKPDIVAKCQDKGFEQAKKLATALAGSSKMMYKRTGGDLTNWPDICKGDKIVEPHDY